MRATGNKAAFCFLFVLQIISLASAQTHVVPDWTTQCKRLVLDRYDASTNGSRPDLTVPHLVGPGGPSAGNVSLEQAWGIPLRVCNQLCSDINVPFEFSNFSTAMTQWLLPWVILTAQLPYETSSPFNDLLSFLLAVGSPAFIMFGLVLTMRTRFRISEGFEKLYELARTDENIRKHPSRLSDRLQEAQYILEESQQAPMRAYDGDGWLSSLLIVDTNHTWWSNAKKDLSNTRRRPTISLVVQILYAFIAWLFTVIVAFGNLGDVVTGLSIASSGIWVWLVPVTSGWVAVGTQAKKGAVAYAVRGPADRAMFLGDDDDTTLAPTRALQNGITSRSGINPPYFATDRRLSQARRRLTAPVVNGQSQHEPKCPTDTDLIDEKGPKRFSFRLAGDERMEGPIYNHARIFTHSQFSRTVQSGFYVALRAIQRGDSETTHKLSTMCGFDDWLPAYPKWKDVDTDVWRDIVIAAVIALFVQWGTSGPSIMLDYLTTVAGLGCRSFSHLLYALFATASFALLFMASLLSHDNMLKYQESAQQGDTLKVPGGPRVALFIVCRVAGILLASCNAVWIVLSTALELSGVFDTCWCNSDRLGLRSEAWVLIFKGGPDLASRAVAEWVGAVVFSSVVVFIASVIIWMGCKRN